MVDFGAAQQRLGRDAAPVEADAAEILALHHAGLHAQLGGPDRGDIATGTAAEDDDIEILISHLKTSCGAEESKQELGSAQTRQGPSPWSPWTSFFQAL